MKIIILLITVFYSSFLGFSQKAISKIAFGSCGKQYHPLPIFDVIVDHKPDLFIFLGDNIYADTDNMDTMKAKYNKLASKPTFQNLQKNVPVIATWDDHDYGQNDVGRHYKHKEESKALFLDFFKEPKDSERRKHAGIYTSYLFDCYGKKLQIILLDGRTFRDNLTPYTNEVEGDKRFFFEKDYGKTLNSDSTFLGKEQWNWLEKELTKPADIRIIGSGSQFGIEYNTYESWANFPLEQQKMIDLIKKTKANGLFFISGDVHYAEISKMNVSGMYPIYDMTSSGLSSKWHYATPNQNRIEGPIMENHFGLVTIDWEQKIPTIKMEVWDINNNQRFEYAIRLDELKFK
jgi:alkaline phosphatase D